MNHLSLLVPLLFALSLIVPILFRLFRSGPREARVVVEYAQRRGYALVNPVTVFNLGVTSRRADNSGGSIRYKVAKIKAAGLPRFSLGRNSALHTFENVVDKIAGASKPAVNLDARQYPEFSAHFWIKGPDPAAVTAFLSGAKIRFLEAANLQGTLATNANYLVYFEDGVLVTEQDFDSFIGRAETLVANLL